MSAVTSDILGAMRSPHVTGGDKLWSLIDSLFQTFYASIMASDIAMQLATGCFSSKAVVMVDSVITQSLFLNTKRRPVGMSSIEPLAVNFSLEEEQRERVYNAISKGLKEKKTGMTMTAAYLASADQSAIEIQATDSVLKQLGEEGRSCISW